MTFKTWQELVRDSDAGRFAPERAEALIDQAEGREKAGDARGGNEGASVGAPSPPNS